MLTIPKWSENTREERFFTAMLFQALLGDSKPFWALLRPQLKIAEEVAIVDVGYEVCLFRDFAHADLICKEDAHELRKQTIDLVLTLSNCSLVLIEAKVHESFSRAQWENMIKAREKLLNAKQLGLADVHLVALHSSEYRPINMRFQYANFPCVTWKDLASAYACIYSGLSRDFQRADGIYAN